MCFINVLVQTYRHGETGKRYAKSRCLGDDSDANIIGVEMFGSAHLGKAFLAQLFSQKE